MTLFQDNDDCVLLLRMLSLGLGAWNMIDSQQFKEAKLVRTPLIITSHIYVTMTSVSSASGCGVRDEVPAERRVTSR